MLKYIKMCIFTYRKYTHIFPLYPFIIEYYFDSCSPLKYGSANPTQLLVFCHPNTDLSRYWRVELARYVWGDK